MKSREICSELVPHLKIMIEQVLGEVKDCALRTKEQNWGRSFQEKFLYRVTVQAHSIVKTSHAVAYLKQKQLKPLLMVHLLIK